MEEAALEHHTVRQAAFEGAVDRLLGRHHGDLGEACNDDGGTQCFVHELVVGHHAADQAGTFGFHRVHHATGQGHVHRLGFAHCARQTLRTACAGDHAQFDFGLAEFGVFSGDDEIAHHGQLTATAQRKTADSGNDGLADGADRFPVAGDVVALVGVGKTVFRHGANIGSGGERSFTAGNDHAADLLVGIKRLQGGPQFIHQLIVQRVELLGTVEGDDADLVRFNADFDGFVAHEGSWVVVLVTAEGIYPNPMGRGQQGSMVF
ncbi:hypothetical protein D3C71_1509510 [compost metagenome]